MIKTFQLLSLIIHKTEYNRRFKNESMKRGKLIIFLQSFQEEKNKEQMKKGRMVKQMKEKLNRAVKLRIG